MKTQIKQQVVITLDYDEAVWLKAIMQNPIWTTVDDEEPYDRDMRRRYWEALDSVHFAGEIYDGTS